MKFLKMFQSERDSPESDAAAAAAVTSLHEHGYAHLPGVLSAKECDAICADFARYVAKHSQEADKHVMGTGRHSRLTNMHLVSNRARASIAKSG